MDYAKAIAEQLVIKFGDRFKLLIKYVCIFQI